MNKLTAFLLMCGSVFLSACDLQPKITSVPDNIAEFITVRYPALLADPDTNPQVYESAASDYGVYASPEIYGTDAVDDYVLYASPDDYVYVQQVSVDTGEPVLVAKKREDVKKNEVEIEISKPAADDYLVVPMYGGVKKSVDEKISEPELVKQTYNPYITVVAGDTLYSLAKKYSLKTDDLAEMNNLTAPFILSIGQKLKIEKIANQPVKTEDIAEIKQEKIIKTETTKSTPEMTKVSLKEITVAAGDTLYSVSRRYKIPVNDLAVLNKLSAPFALSVGQKIRVPAIAPVEYTNAEYMARFSDSKQTATTSKASTASKVPTKTTTATKTATASKTTASSKISSDPTKKMPTLSSRSSSKFSWPVRGKILSGYGAKSGGLFNDGINISASLGTAVRAAENGAVAYAGNEVKGMGNLVIIQHSDGWMTVYAHMDKMSVKRGSKVNVGQQIGTIGKTGKVSVPQLHFEIRKGSKAYDPTKYLKK